MPPAPADDADSPAPVILLAPPRSGAGLLAALLEADPRTAAGPLSRGHLLDEIPGLAAAERDFTSHRLTAADADGAEVAEVAEVGRRYAAALRDIRGAAAESTPTPNASPQDDVPQIVEWNPRLGLRGSLLAAALPDARFIVVLRRPAPTISSLMRSWRTGSFATIDDLPDWWGEPWSFGLIPGWRDLIGAPPAEVCARQWGGYVDAILDDVAELDPDRWRATSLERLLADPAGEVGALASWLGWEPPNVPDELPVSRATFLPPDRTRWQSDLSEISAAMPGLQGTLDRFTTFRDSWAPEPESTEEPTVEPLPANRTRTTVASAGTPFSSKHTSTFPELLGLGNASVVVTTYKSGHLIFLRRDEQGHLNTEFTSYPRPMGVAQAGSRLSLGIGTAIVNLSNTPALAAALDPPNVNDVVYTTRSVLHTGDIAMHEMAFAGEQLWFVNTRFSCLCTPDPNYSFVPRWRPEWISGLAGEDRCHLNGLALRDGRPRYVTALARTDTAHGWREHKGTAGVIVDVFTNQVVTEGLAMPHSPRWHDGRLWVLESGRGALATVDPTTGAVTTVATVPGFTRGLAFIGPYALIGLSQVRESVFKDLPVTQTADERNCGVWVVDTRSGNIAGFVRFEGIVQEIFDVQVLPGQRWPTILADPTDLTANSFVLPDDALAQIAEPASEASADA